ncbi:hypothetical protein [Neolewinella sp.]|uniref:sulfotransferase-like domain-containing protein n=1 Tax=Neolewinella sp. TaxID=2993543 RepID=UPI003B52E844
MKTHQRVNLWSSPRNISTALLYAFAQRGDTCVLDEPLYAHYLLHQPTTAEHPGAEEVLASQENDGTRVISQLSKADYGSPVLVCKQMTHHLVGLPRDFLARMDNVLLIRDPREILASFSKVVTGVTELDVGLPQQAALFDYLEQMDQPPPVVDARRLLLAPAATLQRLCQRLRLEYDPAMLHWPAGPKPYDGSWAPYWYAGVHASTGFLPYRAKPIYLSPTLSDIAERCRPVYERLLHYAI